MKVIFTISFKKTSFHEFSLKKQLEIIGRTNNNSKHKKIKTYTYLLYKKRLYNFFYNYSHRID